MELLRGSKMTMESRMMQMQHQQQQQHHHHHHRHHHHTHHHHHNSHQHRNHHLQQHQQQQQLDRGGPDDAPMSYHLQMQQHHQPPPPSQTNDLNCPQMPVQLQHQAGPNHSQIPVPPAGLQSVPAGTVQGQAPGGKGGFLPQGSSPMDSKSAQAPSSPPGSGGNGSCRLFVSSLLEPRDELDERHAHCHQLVSSLQADRSEKEAHEALLTAVSRDSKAHEDVCIGLLVSVLGSHPSGDPGGSPTGTDAMGGGGDAGRYLRDLTLVSRDGLQCVVAYLGHLAAEKYPKLVLGAKQQVLWVTKEMVRTGVALMDSVCLNLMRQIAGGDVSPGNLWLAGAMIDLLTEHRAWLDKHPFLVASSAYTFLRLLEDHHGNAGLEKLREKEARFAVGLVRDRFADVLIIGRDLVRVLQHVAHVPEVEALWRDLLQNPRSLSPAFSGIPQLMQTRTSRRFLQSRITPEMEKKLVFLTSQVCSFSTSCLHKTRTCIASTNSMVCPAQGPSCMRSRRFC